LLGLFSKLKVSFGRYNLLSIITDNNERNWNYSVHGIFVAGYFWTKIYRPNRKHRCEKCNYIQGVSKKTEQNWNCSQFRKTAISIYFLMYIASLGTYKVE
jgi:hypothetical protein